MKANLLSYFVSACALLAASGVLFTAETVYATIPYGSLSGGVPGGVGPGFASPTIVPGKEYSHNLDMDAAGVLSPEQVIAWDGSGGVANGLNYVGTRPTFTTLSEVDATANRRDHLYKQLISSPDAATDTAHLIFSVDDSYTGYTGGVPFPGIAPSAGPILLPLGPIGGAGELSYELAGAFLPPSTTGTWAKQADINGMPFPIDVDGVEVWGPEPALVADADKYSLDIDILSFGVVPGDAVSVWNLSGTPYILHSTIASSVAGLMGFPPVVEHESINLDALMVQDLTEDPNKFEPDPTGGDTDHDSIIFSIRQIPDGAGGYHATGSELFVLTAAGGISFLEHGGHLWDKTYAMTAFDVWFDDQDNFGVLDINAIEAISQGVVPEPSGIMLLLLGSVGIGCRRRRRAG